MMLALDPPSQDIGAGEPRPRPTSRRRLAVVVVLIVILVVASNVGDVLTTTWADKHPLWLVLLNARNRVLILTTNQLGPVAYYLAGTFRLVLSDPLFFILGLWYGDAAVRWAERKSPSYGNILRTFEQLFSKAAYPLVFLAPNNYICLFAGAAEMRLGVFVVLNVTGTIARLYAIRWLGDAFQRPIDDVLHFFAHYRIPLLILSFAIVMITLWSDRRKGRSEIGSVTDFEDQLSEDEP